MSERKNQAPRGGGPMGGGPGRNIGAKGPKAKNFWGKTTFRLYVETFYRNHFGICFSDCRRNLPDSNTKDLRGSNNRNL